jgi:DNA polymerase V
VDIKNFAATNFSIKLLNKLGVQKNNSMDDFFSEPVYKGTKRFTQQQVPTANATGFGAAADDYAERGIDLNEQLILNKPATFFFRMKGDAMIKAGILPDDVLIVDRSIKATSGRIVVIALKGELLVRLLEIRNNTAFLLAANDSYPQHEVTKDSDYMAWGVVTCIIHILESRLKVLYQEE